MTLFEVTAWIGGLCFLGLVITAGLLAFNLDVVRRGDPTLPFALAWVGYPGLLILTGLFAVRFLHAFEGG